VFVKGVTWNIFCLPYWIFRQSWPDPENPPWMDFYPGPLGPACPQNVPENVR